MLENTLFVKSFSLKSGSLFEKKIVLGTHYYPYYTYIKTEVWDLENQKRCQREFQVYFIAVIRRMTCHGYFVTQSKLTQT